MQSIGFVKIFIVLLFSLILSACSLTSPKTSQHTNLDYKQMQSNYIKAAHKYLQQAISSNNQTHYNEYMLSAVYNFIQAKEEEKAEQLLNEIIMENISPEQKDLKNMVTAELKIKQQQYALAEKYINYILHYNNFNNDLKIRFFQARSTIYLKSNHMVAFIKDKEILNNILQDNFLIQENNIDTWNALLQLTPNTLINLQSSQNDDYVNSWLKIVSILKQYESSPEQKQRSIVLWKENKPSHPAIKMINDKISYLTPIDSVGNNNKKNKTKSKIGLMLPFTDNNVKASEAIKDGFVTAYYADKGNKENVEIAIYDTSNPTNVIAAYNKAIIDQVDFIVGPLTKTEVENINSIGKLEIPVLALNTLQNTNKKHNYNLYQFGLPPESQATAIAEKAKQDGYQNALVLLPKDSFGNRMNIAFTNYWENLGGKILAQEFIDHKTKLSNTIEALLGIQDSKLRAEKLKRTGIKFNFNPRRRQDPDFVFIATNSSTAKQIKPLLNFNYAAALPVYASYNVYSLQKNQYDLDLDGIMFCDMPWILDPNIKLRNRYKTISKISSDNFSSHARLYALGLDAYQIIKELDYLKHYNNYSISGMTGMLSLNTDNIVERKLTWAIIKNGKAVLEHDNK